MMMKLNVTFEHDEETGRSRAVITDDRGERLPNVINVEVSHSHQEVPNIVITLIANGENVTLGVPKRRE